MRQNQVLFVVGGVTLSSRLIDGQFPNYRQLLPEEFEHELTVARAELEEALTFLVPRLPGLAPDGPAVLGNLEGIYGVESLPLRWGA